MTMKRARRPIKSLNFCNPSPSFILNEFSASRDKAYVIREGPWSFDKHLVLINEVKGTLKTHQIKFTRASFWICLHNLPLMARNESMGRMIGNNIGESFEVDIDEDEMTWGELMRIRVNINMTKPLPRGKKINVGTEKPSWIYFSYDRLPNFCYYCGQLGHGFKNCAKG